MFFNCYKFYDYTQLENSSLCSENFLFFDPKFVVNFNFKLKEKKKILQTADLLSQFFSARPCIKSIKKLGRITNFCVSISPNFNSMHKIFKIIHIVRSSSRKKLISFNLKKSGFFYIALKDFVTLFPFKIKTYDFHDWRSQFVLNSRSRISNFSEYKKYNFINFYFSYFFPY